MQPLALKCLFDDLEYDGTQFTYDKFRFPFVVFATNNTFHFVGHHSTTNQLRLCKWTGWLVISVISHERH